MSASTGPIVAAGIITWANVSLFEPEGEFTFDGTVRIGVATGLAAGMLSLVGKASPDLATGLAYAVLVTVLFVPVDYDPINKRLRTSRRSTHSPATRALDFLGVSK